MPKISFTRKMTIDQTFDKNWSHVSIINLKHVISCWESADENRRLTFKESNHIDLIPWALSQLKTSSKNFMKSKFASISLKLSEDLWFSVFKRNKTEIIRWNLLHFQAIFEDNYLKINLNFYFRTSLWCLKRFYEGLHKTIWGTTKEMWK